MKYILELILTTVIVFFVWNYLQRIFFTPKRNFPNRNPSQQNNSQSNSQNRKSQHGLNWDAEDAEYEEIKEEEKVQR